MALTAETKRALTGTSAWIADSLLNHWAGRTVDIDIAKLELQALSTANAQIESLTSSLSKEADLTVNVSAVELSRFSVDNARLNAEIAVRGKVAATILQLPID